MSDQLLFHEKCNRDVREILDRLDKRSTEEENKRTEFLVRLTEAYQLIYESATSSSIPIHEMDIPWNR